MLIIIICFVSMYILAKTIKLNEFTMYLPYYRCLFCKDSFASEMDLQCHLTTHNKPLKCSMCDEGFNVEYLLDKHMHDVHANPARDRSPRGGASSQPSPVKIKVTPSVGQKHARLARQPWQGQVTKRGRQQSAFTR